MEFECTPGEKVAIEAEIAKIKDPETEFTVVDDEYINALQVLHDGLLARTWGDFDQIIQTVVLTSYNLIAENRTYRKRLKDAVREILEMQLRKTRVSFGRINR